MAKQAITELVAIMSTITPVSAVTETLTGTQIDMYEFHEALFIAHGDSIATTGVFHLDIWGGAGSGVNSAVITGKTAATSASSVTASYQVIRVTAEEAAAQGYRYLFPLVTCLGTSAYIAMTGFGVHPRYAPADELDIAAVSEIIT